MSDLFLEVPPVPYKTLARARVGASRITKRELEVLSGILSGATSKVIANELRISPRTVDIYRAQLLQKFGVRNSIELARVVTELLHLRSYDEDRLEPEKPTNDKVHTSAS